MHLLKGITNKKNIIVKVSNSYICISKTIHHSMTSDPALSLHEQRKDTDESLFTIYLLSSITENSSTWVPHFEKTSDERMSHSKSFPLLNVDKRTLPLKV